MFQYFLALNGFRLGMSSQKGSKISKKKCFSVSDRFYFVKNFTQSNSYEKKSAYFAKLYKYYIKF